MWVFRSQEFANMNMSVITDRTMQWQCWAQCNYFETFLSWVNLWSTEPGRGTWLKNRTYIEGTSYILCLLVLTIVTSFYWNRAHDLPLLFMVRCRRLCIDLIGLSRLSLSPMSGLHQILFMLTERSYQL